MTRHGHGDGHEHEQFGSDYWEHRYRSGEPTSKHRVSPSLVDEAGDLPPGRALDAGCGTGADARWLADRGWEVTAVDVSATAVATARTTDGRVDWQVADLTTWTPGEQRFDLVTSHHVHVPGPVEGLVARLGSWVAPGGMLLVVGHAHGHEQPAEAQVGADQLTGALPPEQWEVVTAETRTHTVAHPDGSGEVALHDVVVRARRRA